MQRNDFFPQNTNTPEQIRSASVTHRGMAFHFKTITDLELIKFFLPTLRARAAKKRQPKAPVARHRASYIQPVD